ncbi:hypothetical protein MmiEs2_02170 [Methanimicrococcus stummii]|uniref:Periplasmic copper-binding protein NosD beta helix domain-containing protein n=1 Tax=Methanimicrococcus stummii TaxID=3028294 RepID=A0AA96VKI7_9EURY|nr:right-handed parallel beta-helix repeat-containing protein [Methanimicrococcus sp. Es2]WNY28037.1 hypothetical protein MmiEs2_02170 [Methanimicrococcus sp. Es2]
MKNNFKNIGKALLLSFLILLALTGTAAAKEWTVGATGADFQTLPEAVTAASDGDTILISAGLYETSANISVGKTLTIEGADRETVILDLGGFSIIPKKENFVLRNVTIYNGSNGINLQTNANDAVIENCIFDSLTHKDGIKLAKDGAVFKNNIVKNMNGFTTAVNVTGNEVQIIGNTLSGLSGSGNAARILCLENASDALIEGNTITNNAGEAIRLWKAETANAVITKNTISGNTQKGIYLYAAGENNEIYLNNIFDNAGGNVASSGALPDVVSFNSPSSLTLVYNSQSWTGNPGNYWGDDYDGADNGKGIGSTQKTILDKYADLSPLMYSFAAYSAESGNENPEQPEEPEIPGPQPGKTGNPISMTTNILPSLSVSFSIDSLDFGDLAAGQTSAPKDLEITNSGGCDVKVTAEVTESSDDLYKRGIWIDNEFWPDFEKVVENGETEISEVVLKVPADYSGTGNVDGTLIFWVEAC